MQNPLWERVVLTPSGYFSTFDGQNFINLSIIFVDFLAKKLAIFA
jgi:hypothetical protein